MTDKHPSHSPEIPKLNRVSGQVDGIKRMIEEGRYCPEILAQLRAVRSALRSIEANVLEAHLQHCVSEAIINGSEKEKNARISEIKDLFKRYEGA